MKKFHGFTLMELLVALVIGVSLFLTIVPMAETFGREETARRLNRDADLLLESMNQFYHRHCSDAVFPTVTEAALRAEGLLFGGGFNNPWGNNYQLVIDRSIPRNPQLRVLLVFTSAIDAGYVAGFSENAIASGVTVTWTVNSTFSRTQDGVMRQLDREAFGTPLC